MKTFASSELVLASWILVGIYMVVLLAIVIRGALKIKSISDYSVGNVVFSPIAVGLSLAASITSAATFIINPGLIALYGISGVITLGVVLPFAALISLYVLTKGFRKQGQAVKALTMAQWIGKRYGSETFAFFFALLSLLLLTFVVLICVGLTSILSQALGIQPLYALIGLVTFVFGYMMFGGANSMIYTNLIQAVLMLIVAFILLGSGLDHLENGIGGFLEKLKAIDPNLVTPVNPDSFLFRDYFEVVFCAIVVGVAIVCQPHIITKSLMLKDEGHVNTFLRTGIIAETFFFLVVIAGLYARLEFPDLTVDGVQLKTDTIISAYVVKKFPVYIGLVVILGLISAGLSTLEGLVQSLSTTVTSDIAEPLCGWLGIKKLEGKQAIWFNRGVIVVLGVVAVLISYDQISDPDPKQTVAILAQNGVYAYFSAAFVPVLFGTFLPKVSRQVVVAASLVAVITHFSVYYGELTMYTQGELKNPGVASALAISASVLVGLGGHYLSKKKKPTPAY